jgi:solute carrier family 8 (sodium/calcium exchanger)
VKYKTRDGTATSVDDYEAAEDVIIFEKGETKKPLLIKIHDDNAYEDNEEFYVDLSDPQILEDESAVPKQAKLSETDSVVVVIIDDDDPGVLRVKDEDIEVMEGKPGVCAEIVVERVGGASGTITCKYRTENMLAVAGMDYEETQGHLELGPAVQSTVIKIPIIAKGRYEKTADFIVRLLEPNGCVFDKETDGGEESCICHITIKGNTDEAHVNVLKRMQSRINSQHAIMGHRHWKQQFWDALFQVTDDDDEDDEKDDDEGPSKIDIFMHIVSVPWKLLFAFVPPVDYCGGWCCFFCSLCMIALVTAIVEQLANLVGCCIPPNGIHPEITAITFVALGTSLPDTFASKAAATIDPYADASIANVTGSNSVNVFIGLGLSWSIAAIYWAKGKPTVEWLNRVSIPGQPYYDVREDVASAMKDGNAVFVSPAGSLNFNVAVFVFNAFWAIQHLLARRKKFGGELGGPNRGWFGQYFSACFLLFQWVIYIVASSIYAELNSTRC